MTNLNFNDVLIPDDIQILILEDEVVFQKKMMSTLGDIGFKGKLHLARSISEAKGIIQKIKPDLILSDWNVLDGVGIDFLKFIRSDSTYSAVPYLMVTTMDNIDNILGAIGAGADGYIVKPWDEIEVIEKVAFAFEKRRNT